MAGTMTKPRRILFVCEGNLHRSPTAERLDSATPGIDARSAGLSDLARVRVTEELVAWADAAFVMEGRLRKMLRRRFPAELIDKTLVCLDVPDDFQFLQPELLTILAERLLPHLGPPASGGQSPGRPNAAPADGPGE